MKIKSQINFAYEQNILDDMILVGFTQFDCFKIIYYE